MAPVAGEKKATPVAGDRGNVYAYDLPLEDLEIQNATETARPVAGEDVNSKKTVDDVVFGPESRLNEALSNRIRGRPKGAKDKKERKRRTTKRTYAYSGGS